VPLRAAFMMPDKRLVPLLGENGKLNRELAAMIERPVLTSPGSAVAKLKGIIANL
jgi:hypothetical protein